MFNFQHSQITQKEFEQIADLLLKYPKVYATRKLDVGKVNSLLHLHLKRDAVFKKQRVIKVPIHSIEPIQVTLTKVNGIYFTTADMNSAYNQMPLNELSQRLTQFVIGNQQYEFNRLISGIFIGPAAFSAFMSKIVRPLILNKNAITYLDDVLMQSQTKNEMFYCLRNISSNIATRKHENSPR